jgi:hypothetical protein
MFWIRAHLTVATAIIASTHVTAIAATSHQHHAERTTVADEDYHLHTVDSSRAGH